MRDRTKRDTIYQTGIRSVAPRAGHRLRRRDGDLVVAFVAYRIKTDIRCIGYASRDKWTRASITQPPFSFVLIELVRISGNGRGAVGRR